MSAKSQWFGPDAPQETETDEGSPVDAVAGWESGLRCIPRA
jgi:hypothetical protein